MYIAHTNLQSPEETTRLKPVRKELSPADQFAYEMALKGWQKAIKKHAAAISEIREVFPGWAPQFKYPF